MFEQIKHISVLGAGVMGSRIACTLANAGFEVLLLDMVNEGITPQEIKKGYSTQDAFIRNKKVRESFEYICGQKPSPLFSSSLKENITLGNFTDDFKNIGNSQWIIEAVSEKLEIKNKLFDLVEKYRNVNSIISTNTSGISIETLCLNRSQPFKSHFIGTHFFNPPRYLSLLEVIPSSFTKPELVDFFLLFADKFLARTPILCKDTPAFIGNRMGIFSIFCILHLANEMDLNIVETDSLTGKLLGKPASATYRTSDIVGLDTLTFVANDLYNNLPNDESKHIFKQPDYLLQMQQAGYLGDKSGSGFYKKIKTADGKSIFLSLNFKNLEYEFQQNNLEAQLLPLQTIKDLKSRLLASINLDNQAGHFYRKYTAQILSYAANRIPEITNHFQNIDLAMKTGFGWEMGPFEIWDSIGIDKGIQLINECGLSAPSWILNPPNSFTSFYKIQDKQLFAFNFDKSTYIQIEGSKTQISLSLLKPEQVIWQNGGVNLLDLNDSVLLCEFTSKMNSITPNVLEGITQCLKIAEEKNNALVIANQGKNFSVGADLAYILQLSLEKNWQAIDDYIHFFQQTSLYIRYSSIPVVLATHEMVLGGACEFCLHADFVQMAPETKIGLVETNVGLIPAGGGTKEFTLKASDSFASSQINEHILKEYFFKITDAKVSESAFNALEMGYLNKKNVAISSRLTTLIYDAKQQAIKLLNSNYISPKKNKPIKILGKPMLALLQSLNFNLKSAGLINAHQEKIFNSLAYVMCGGNISEQTWVDENYLLKLEREVFLSLCADEESIEKIKAIVYKNKKA